MPLAVGHINSSVMLKRFKTVGFFVSQKKRLIERIIEKIKKENEDEFNRWCSRDKIDKMIEKVEEKKFI